MSTLKIIDHGEFTPYMPEPERLRDLDFPAADPEGGTQGILFTRNEHGRDFYDMEQAGAFAPGSILVSVDEAGITISASFAGSGIVPIKGCRLMELQGDGVPERLEDITRKRVDLENNRLVELLPPPRTSLFKTEIYERMSDEELEQFDAAMKAAPLRTRRMWDDCQQVEAASPLFTTLREDMENAFGKARADAILSLQEAQA